MKKFVNYAFIYAILAMAGGVFYREFTKFCGFTAWTTLSVVHTHYFILGMMFFLVLGLVEKNIHFMDQKTNRAVIGYHVGLNLTAIMLFVRGVLQITAAVLESGEFSHSGSGEKRQFWSKEKSQHIR